MLTDTLSSLGLANIGMPIAIARNTKGEGTTVGRVVMESGCARLAKLTDVAVRTLAVFHPIGRFAGCATMSRL